MSRIGKQPITLTAGVTIDVRPTSVVVKGPKGELRQELLKGINISVADSLVTITVDKPEDRKERSLWGLYRTLVANMIYGVSVGFEKKLEIKGVGYRAATQGNNLVLNLGFSHPIEFPLPSGISALVEANTITISGFDKYLVGETAAKIRKFRSPEPYKGKGVKYIDEVIRRKAGKAAAK
jgi:large subunit ribosomal protein L6